MLKTDSPFVRNTRVQLLFTGRTLFGKGVFSGTSHSSSPEQKLTNDVIACKLRMKSSCLDVTLHVLRRLELAAGVGASCNVHTVRTIINSADE